MKYLILPFLLLSLWAPTFAQDSTKVDDDMAALLNDGGKPEIIYSFATFKSTRIVNLQSCEQASKKHLDFRISHRFGPMSLGAYDMFGLDQASIRLGFEYGITDYLMVGVGRNSFEKSYDGFIKGRILRQSKGGRVMPITLSAFGSIALSSLKQPDGRTNYFSSRLAYSFQLIIARKFHERFSFQLSPTLVHRNLVRLRTDENTVFALGAGMRFKLSKRMSINAEYIALMPGTTRNQYNDVFSLGLDIETGGHVFQVFVSNSQYMIEKQFVAQTTNSWAFWQNDGSGGTKIKAPDICFGFNISRMFSFDRKNQKSSTWGDSDSKEKPGKKGKSTKKGS